MNSYMGFSLYQKIKAHLPQYNTAVYAKHTFVSIYQGRRQV